MKEQQPVLISFGQLIGNQLELNDQWIEIKKQLCEESFRRQKVVAKLNNEVHLLLGKLSERDKVGSSTNRLSFFISTLNFLQRMNALEQDRANLSKTVSKLLLMTRRPPYKLRSKSKMQKENVF